MMHRCTIFLLQFAACAGKVNGLTVLVIHPAKGTAINTIG